MSYTKKVHISTKNEASIADYARDIASIWPNDASTPADEFWLYVVKHATKACESVRRNQWDETATSLSEVTVWWLSFMNKVTTKPQENGNDPTDWITYIDSDADQIIWHKYPFFCPHCFGRKASEMGLFDENNSKEVLDEEAVQRIIKELEKKPQCTCLGEKGPVENRSNEFKDFVSRNVSAYAERNKEKKKPESMKGFVDMFGRIYENTVEVLSIEDITFHLFEEVGEVATALTNLLKMERAKPKNDEELNCALKERRNKVRAFAEELADVFSWSNTLVSKINRHLSCASDLVKKLYVGEESAQILTRAFERAVQENTNLVDLIWRQHSTPGSNLVCEHCKKPKCECLPRYSEHRTGQRFTSQPLEGVEKKVIENCSKVYGLEQDVL
jgi:NTP pyrophosphatase (non-canonical NTP hydrolase)